MGSTIMATTHRNPHPVDYFKTAEALNGAAHAKSAFWGTKSIAQVFKFKKEKYVLLYSETGGSAETAPMGSGQKSSALWMGIGSHLGLQALSYSTEHLVQYAIQQPFTTTGFLSDWS